MTTEAHQPGQLVDNPQFNNGGDIRNINILVAGVVRNCGQAIKEDVARLSAVVGQCASLHWLIVESDSSDNTVEKLHELQTEVRNFRFITVGNLLPGMPIRTNRIAFCRNRYLDELRTNAIYKDIDYVVVADLDGLNRSITPEAFWSCFQKTGWDVCTANQRGPYYDIWSLRHPEWCPGDCWSEYKSLLRNNVGREKALVTAVHSKMIVIPETADWIEVDAAFGGIAIYRKDVMIASEYAGLTETGEEVCDNVPFHKKIKENGGHIFINPRFINSGYNAHTKPLLLRNRVRRACQNFIREIAFKTHIRKRG